MVDLDVKKEILVGRKRFVAKVATLLDRVAGIFGPPALALGKVSVEIGEEVKPHPAVVAHQGQIVTILDQSLFPPHTDPRIELPLDWTVA